MTKTQLNITNKNQEVTPFPASNEQTRKHDKHKTQITQMIHKRSSKNILLESLNRFHGANLTLSSDVEQDT